jgi:hypothetical protein
MMLAGGSDGTEKLLTSSFECARGKGSECSMGYGSLAGLVNALDFLHRQGASRDVHFGAVAELVLPAVPDELSPCLRERVGVGEPIMKSAYHVGRTLRGDDRTRWRNWKRKSEGRKDRGTGGAPKGSPPRRVLTPEISACGLPALG